MTAIIGLTGKKGSGKSTLASYITALCIERNIGCTTASFATPLKMACHIVFGGEPAHWWGNKKEEILPHLGKTPRELMQKFGTDFVRDMIDPELWVKTMQETIIGTKAALNHGGVILIDDVRYNNEAAMILADGGKVFRIALDDSVDVLTESVHPSERGVALENITFPYVCAKGDHESLKAIANRILKLAE